MWVTERGNIIPSKLVVALLNLVCYPNGSFSSESTAPHPFNHPYPQILLALTKLQNVSINLSSLAPETFSRLKAFMC